MSRSFSLKSFVNIRFLFSLLLFHLCYASPQTPEPGNGVPRQTLNPDESADSTTLIATLRDLQGKEVGAFAFRQLPNIPHTRVVVEITDSLANTTKAGFPYCLHESSSPKTGHCSGILGVFNPNHVVRTAGCTAKTPDLCQVGELSSRHENLNLQKLPLKATYSDSLLRVLGAQTILGKTLVVRHPKGHIIACGKINLQKK